MYTLLIALVLAGISAAVLWTVTGSVILSVIFPVIVVVLVNVLFGRHFYKKMMALMEAVEKDIKADRIDIAIEKLKSGYAFSNWQFMSRKQIDSQIGSLLYARKRFDEAYPLLSNSIAKNWPAMCMLASYHYRNKDYEKAFKVMDKTVASNKKEGFVYSLYAFMLSEQGKVDKAIDVLNKGVKKLPLDEKLSGELDAVKNKKKIKMQAYGAFWMQMHLGAKTQDGVKQYQSFLMNQKVRRR